jgi:hypothetical protein
MKYIARISLALTTALAVTGGAQQPITIQHIRPVDQRGVNMFEPSKEDTVTFQGTRMVFGGSFRQDFQGLDHSNTAAAKLVTTNGVTTNQNQLIGIGHGFNNATANLNMDVQLTKGVRIAMTSYLSSRHHNETWVKDGYALIDDSPIDNPLLNTIMSHTTLKVGHFEINYGDGHFRRTDNGQAIYNPFIGNYILDAFSTEVGSELYVHDGWWLGMVGMTNGEIRGTIVTPEKRAPAFLGKVGVDHRFSNDDLRLRLTMSAISQSRSASQTLYGGDRGGSPYFDVLEPAGSSEATNAWSGEIRNPFGSGIQGQVINPFVKYHGAELFGQFEWARGFNAGEVAKRKVAQQVYEGLYRFAKDQFYVGGRVINFDGRLFGMTNDVNVNRYQLGGGWFVTKNLLAKGEWVNQNYNSFAATDIRSGGNFKGFMFSGAVSF